jgi:hypothetical protein
MVHTCFTFLAIFISLETDIIRLGSENIFDLLMNLIATSYPVFLFFPFLTFPKDPSPNSSRT